MSPFASPHSEIQDKSLSVIKIIFLPETLFCKAWYGYKIKATEPYQSQHNTFPMYIFSPDNVHSSSALLLSSIPVNCFIFFFYPQLKSSICYKPLWLMHGQPGNWKNKAESLGCQNVQFYSSLKGWKMKGKLWFAPTSICKLKSQNAGNDDW